MSGPDASDDDMTSLWRSRRDQHLVAHLDALASGAPLPLDAEPELRHLSEALAALSTTPEGREDRHGREAALAAFRHEFAMSSTSEPTVPRRRSMLSSLLSAKVVAVVATASGLSLGGAAYAGVLPDAAQNFAHHAVGAPATKPTNGPDPAGHAAYGLCNAWTHNTTHGKASEHGQAFLGLAAAAGGADGVVTYCATVPHPGGKPTDLPSDLPSHPTGKPTDLPTHPTGKPTDLPTHPTHPTGKPTDLPTHPTGKPTTGTHGSGNGHRTN